MVEVIGQWVEPKQRFKFLCPHRHRHVFHKTPAPPGHRQQLGQIRSAVLTAASSCERQSFSVPRASGTLLGYHPPEIAHALESEQLVILET